MVLLPTRRRRLWVFLFIWVASLLVILATGWNVVLVRDYFQMLEIARSLRISESKEPIALAPWTILVLGSLGFAAAIGTIVLFFIKLLREMRLNQLQAEFLATVTHELKTPIASIELSSSLLRSGGLPPGEVERLWGSHQQELKRLREEVETILEAARWQQANASRVSVQRLDLEEWLSQSMLRWRTLLGEHATLAREGAPLPREIKTNLRSLNLITDNLLDNARKFARGAPRVTIRTERVPPQRFWEHPSWKIEIRDEGWGFSQTQSSQLFQRFFRARHEAPYSIPGTGLGLYIAQSACRALRLTLRARSEGKGKGAVFVLQGRDFSADPGRRG